MCTGFYVCTCTCMCVHMYGCIYIDSYMYVCMYNHMLTSIVHVLYVYLHMGHTGDTAWPGLWLAPILQLSFLRRGLGLYRAVGSGEKRIRASCGPGNLGLAVLCPLLRNLTNLHAIHGCMGS